MALVRLLWMFGCLALELCLIKPMPPHHGPPWPTPNLTGLIKLQTILIALYIVSAFLSVCPSRLGRFLVLLLFLFLFPVALFLSSFPCVKFESTLDSGGLTAASSHVLGGTAAATAPAATRSDAAGLGADFRLIFNDSEEFTQPQIHETSDLNRRRALSSVSLYPSATAAARAAVGCSLLKGQDRVRGESFHTSCRHCLLLTLTLILIWSPSSCAASSKSCHPLG